MKKMVALVLVAALLLGCTTVFAVSKSYAESAADGAFILRNGIQFLDSMSIVSGKETATPRDKSESSNDNELIYDGTVAGQNTTIKFTFENDQLHDMGYTFKSINSSNADSVYSSVYSTLVSKYGPELGYTNGNTCHFISD